MAKVTVTQADPTYLVELTAHEARTLRAILGQFDGGDNLGRLWGALAEAGVVSNGRVMRYTINGKEYAGTLTFEEK